MKTVIATGIPGCGRKDRYLTPWESYCRERGKNVKVFPVGEMMFEEAERIGCELNKDNVLNGDPDLLSALHLAVFNRIRGEIAMSGHQYDAIVPTVHSFFYWKKRFQRAYDRSLLSQFSPDVFVTFIDDGAKILERLSGREQWQDEKLTTQEILNWQNVEVETTSGIADLMPKPFFTLAVEQPISTLYKLVFHPEIEPVYIAMPITHLKSQEARNRINAFIKRLDRYFTVFNPLAIEVAGAVPLNDPNIDMTPFHHTVHRDLDWLIRRVKKMVVYWPEKPVPSPGREHETHAAFSKTKDVWVIYPADAASPFVSYFNTKFFRGEEAFFAFLDERYPERKDLNWD